MKIKLTSVYVDDQEKALRFYTDVLGFTKKADVSNASYRWLTVASPEEADGTELQLALNDNPAAKPISRPYSSRASPRPCSSPMTSRPTTSASKPAAPGSPCRRPRYRLDHRGAERHLRQSHARHPAGALVEPAISGVHAAEGWPDLFRLPFKGGLVELEQVASSEFTAGYRI